MSNFTFLEQKWSDLARLGDLSEKYVYSDSNTFVMKQSAMRICLVEVWKRYIAG